MKPKDANDALRAGVSIPDMLLQVTFPCCWAVYSRPTLCRILKGREIRQIDEGIEGPGPGPELASVRVRFMRCRDIA